LAQAAASEIKRDQGVLSCYFRNCLLSKGTHHRAGDPDLGITHGNSPRDCWQQRHQELGSAARTVAGFAAACTVTAGLRDGYTAGMLLAATAAAQSTKGLPELQAETPGMRNHQRHFLTRRYWHSVPLSPSSQQGRRQR